MGYLIAAYAVSVLGLGGYACWLVRERRVLRARLERAAAATAVESPAPASSNEHIA